MSDKTTTIWLGGLPFAGDRPMTNEERATVEGMIRRARRNIILYLAVTPAMFGLLVLTFVVLTSESPITFVLAFVTLMTPAVSVLGTRDHLRQWTALRQDLRLGTISVFEAAEARSETKAKRAETLTFSERLWTVDGVFHRKWQIAPRTEVAATPEYAATAAEWVAPANPANPASPHFNHREMSPAERAELQGFIRLARWFMVPAGAAYTALAIALIAVAVAQHTMPHTGVTYIIPVSALIADISIAQRWIMAGRLSRDLRIGRIVIARKPVDEGGALTLSPPTEFLPASKLVWTHAGQPAPWRKAQRPRRTRSLK